MHKGRLSYKRCGMSLLIVTLLSFYGAYPVRALPPTEPPPGLSENEMKRYSDLEVDTLIEDLSEAALAAIEQAAAEAAKAAAIAGLEREVLAARETERYRAEARRLYTEAESVRRNSIKHIAVTAAVCFVSGFLIGSGTFLLAGGNR